MNESFSQRRDLSTLTSNNDDSVPRHLPGAGSQAVNTVNSKIVKLPNIVIDTSYFDMIVVGIGYLFVRY